MIETCQLYSWLIKSVRNKGVRKWFEPRSNIPWLIKDHMGDWSPEKDCCLRLTFRPCTCAEAIFRVKSLDFEDGFRTGCRNVSRKQQSFLGLQSPRWSFSIKEERSAVRRYPGPGRTPRRSLSTQDSQGLDVRSPSKQEEQRTLTPWHS